jgi:hypothetical protein
MSERWAIYIDLEGFSALWDEESQILWSFGELMRAIFRVGNLCYPHRPYRLFAHQFGDGFLIASEFHEESLTRCATIAIALMRHVAATGRLASAAISEGNFADIEGCYPKEVLDHGSSDHRVDMGEGLMTIILGMGTALVRPYLIVKKVKGPFLLIAGSKSVRLGGDILRTPIPGTSSLMSIDWVHADLKRLTDIRNTARLHVKAPSNVESMLHEYCQNQPVAKAWKDNVYNLLHVPRGMKN